MQKTAPFPLCNEEKNTAMRLYFAYLTACGLSSWHEYMHKARSLNSRRPAGCSVRRADVGRHSVRVGIAFLGQCPRYIVHAPFSQGKSRESKAFFTRGFLRQKSRGRISPGGPQAAEEESSGLSQQPGCLPSERKWSADHGRTLLTGHEKICRPDICMHCGTGAPWMVHLVCPAVVGTG